MSRLEEIGRYQKDYLQKAAEIDVLELEEDAKEELKEDWLSFYRRLVQRDYEVKNRFFLESKKKVVMAGKSKIFETWREHSTITMEDFLEALSWVCDDPKDGGDIKCRLTREIALTPTGIKKLKVVYEYLEFKTYIEIDTGKKWDGEFFEHECDKIWSETGKIKLHDKIMLNADDRI